MESGDKSQLSQENLATLNCDLDYEQVRAETLYAIVVSSFVRTRAAQKLVCEGCNYNEPSQRYHDCLMKSESDRIRVFIPDIISNIHESKMLLREIYARAAVMESFANLSDAFIKMVDLETKYLTTLEGHKKIEKIAVIVSDVYNGSITDDDYVYVSRIVEMIPN